MVCQAIVPVLLAIYLQHVMFHAVPALWRVHRMHHADLDFNVTTGSGFHPIEILLSMSVKFTVIAATGAVGNLNVIEAGELDSPIAHYTTRLVNRTQAICSRAAATPLAA